MNDPLERLTAKPDKYVGEAQAQSFACYIPAEDPDNGPCPHCGLWKPIHDFRCPDRWDGPLREEPEPRRSPAQS